MGGIRTRVVTLARRVLSAAPDPYAMSELTRAQVRTLLERAEELRHQSQRIGRELERVKRKVAKAGIMIKDPTERKSPAKRKISK